MRHAGTVEEVDRIAAGAQADARSGVAANLEVGRRVRAEPEGQEGRLLAGGAVSMKITDSPGAMLVIPFSAPRWRSSALSSILQPVMF